MDFYRKIWQFRANNVFLWLNKPFILMMSFEKTIEVRWADTDPNQHVRHSAYYDYGAHSRIRFFEANGFDASTMRKLNIGPVIFKEECTFIRELHLNDTIKINLLIDKETNADGSRWILHHEIFTQTGEKSAHITLKGAWIDLEKRKLTIPPKELAIAFHKLPIGENYIHKKRKK